MKDLNKYIVEQQAAQWEILAGELGLKDYHIANITKDHPNNSVTSCRVMLQKWLDSDPLASWSKLDDAVKKIKSPTTGPASFVSSDNAGSCITIVSYHELYGISKCVIDSVVLLLNTSMSDTCNINDNLSVVMFNN